MSELERKNGPSAVAETVTKDGRRIGTEVLFSAKDITKTFGGTQAPVSYTHLGEPAASST